MSERPEKATVRFGRRGADVVDEFAILPGQIAGFIHAALRDADEAMAGTNQRRQPMTSYSRPTPAAREHHQKRGQAIADARRLDARGDAEGRHKAQHLLAQAEKYDRLIDDSQRYQGRFGHALSVQGGRILWGGRELVLPPSGPTSERLGVAYAAGFSRYLKNYGEQFSQEYLGLQVSKDAQGGYLAPVEWTARLAGHLGDTVSVRKMATVFPLEPGAVLEAASWDTDYSGSTWSAEVPSSDISEDDSSRYGRRRLTPHLQSRLVKVSTTLVRGAAISIDDHVGERLGNRCAQVEEEAFLVGTGANQPLGVYVASDEGIPTSQDTAASSTTDFDGDDVLNCLFSLREVYIRASTWVVHRGFVRRCRLLKDGNGQYLWSEGLGGAPDLIAGRPYEMSEYAPNTYTAGSYVACVGAFEHYWIADSLDAEVQRLDELFRLENKIGYLIRREVDGQPCTPEAFARLRLAS